MSRRKVPVIAITDTETRVFESVNEAAEYYGIQPPNLVCMIKSGRLHRDGRTTFDYLFETDHIT